MPKVYNRRAKFTIVSGFLPIGMVFYPIGISFSSIAVFNWQMKDYILLK
jgi:hypothetical protein